MATTTLVSLGGLSNPSEFNFVVFNSDTVTF